MGKLVLAILLAGVGLLSPTPSVSLPTVIEIQPARGDNVDVRVAVGEGVLLKAKGVGLKAQGKRLFELTAPGSLEITAGEGAIELSSVDSTSSFVLKVSHNLGRVTRLMEARGERATIRVLAGDVELSAPSASMREVRTP
jgi:uncharacterized protein (DUF2345 family)